jgi:hypothetical protein
MITDSGSATINFFLCRYWAIGVSYHRDADHCLHCIFMIQWYMLFYSKRQRRINTNTICTVIYSYISIDHTCTVINQCTGPKTLEFDPVHGLMTVHEIYHDWLGWCMKVVGTVHYCTWTDDFD